MRFAKGRSGNPGGRPKASGDIRDLARQHSEAALQTLVEIAAHGENESARVAAANAILDRGWGKPAVPLVADAPQVITLNFGGKFRQPEQIQDTRAMVLTQPVDGVEGGTAARTL